MRKHPVLCLLLVPLLLGGCAATTPRAPLPAAADCLAVSRALDARVAAARVGDGEAARIEGFPFLRVDRMLASFRTDLDSPATLHAWLTRLAALDASGRAVEAAALGASAADAARLATCRAQAVEAVLGNPAAQQQLRERARVPDDYRLLARVLGGYPLAAEFARSGVVRLQDRERPHAGVVVGPGTRAYASVTGDPVPPAARLATLPRDALGFPLPSASDLDVLFRQHAPLWLVETASPDDSPGTVQLGAEGRPLVAGDPTEYRYVSHTRFDGQVLLQLNYMVWFPARSPTRRLDLLAGDFDAVIWRVTLDVDGLPLLHDSVHACGCYQIWWPGPRLRRLPGTDTTEPPWIAPVPDTTGKLAVQLDARTHYVRGVGPAPAATTIGLKLAGYDTLRRLPAPQGGTRSLFAPDGLLHESARPERFVLWPLGVPSAGTLRQRGRQATAFVGRRHFDDAFGVARYFERVRGRWGRIDGQ